MDDCIRKTTHRSSEKEGYGEDRTLGLQDGGDDQAEVRAGFQNEEKSPEAPEDMEGTRGDGHTVLTGEPSSGHIFNIPVVYITALFTIARTWKQPRGPSTDAWIKKLWYTYTMEYYSAIKRDAFDSVLTRWMNLELTIQSEGRKRKTNIIY